MVRFLISLSEDTRETLKKIAASRGQTLNGLIRQILWEWVREQEKAAEQEKR